MVVIGMFDYYSAAPVKQTDLSYTKFLQQVDEDKIKQVTIVDNIISGKLSDGKEFTTVVPNNDANLISKLQAKNVDIKSIDVPESPFLKYPFSGNFTFSLVG